MGEVGGVELGAVVTAVESLGVGGQFSTSADMAPSEARWTSGRLGVDQAGSSGSARSSERMTPNTHTCFSSCESGAEKGDRVKKKKMECTHTHTKLQ